MRLTFAVGGMVGAYAGWAITYVVLRRGHGGNGGIDRVPDYVPPEWTRGPHARVR